MGTKKTFQNINFKNKKRVAPFKWKHMHRKCRVHKMVTPLGITRGSSLNLGWGKCGIWVVDQWVPTSLCAFVCLTVDYTLRDLDIIILDSCLVIVFVWGIDMLIILIDPFDYPHILTLLIVWLLCSPWHIHSSCCLSRSFWHDWFSWLYIIMIIMEHVILARYSSWLSYFLLSLCVDLDDIFLFCMIAWCMTALFLHDACIACLFRSHTYPFISNSLVSVELVFLDLVFHMIFVALFALRLS